MSETKENYRGILQIRENLQLSFNRKQPNSLQTTWATCCDLQTDSILTYSDLLQMRCCSVLVIILLFVLISLLHSILVTGKLNHSWFRMWWYFAICFFFCAFIMFCFWKLLLIWSVTFLTAWIWYIGICCDWTIGTWRTW